MRTGLHDRRARAVGTREEARDALWNGGAELWGQGRRRETSCGREGEAVGWRQGEKGRIGREGKAAG